MTELLFSADADTQLSALEHDSARAGLWARINDGLDEIEANPASPQVRVRRYRDPPVWGVPVRWASDDWLILWAETERGPLILYIGEDPR